jgi:hypothetical protein
LERLRSLIIVKARSTFDLPGRIFEHFGTNTRREVGLGETSTENLNWSDQIGSDIGRSNHQLAG